MVYDSTQTKTILQYFFLSLMEMPLLCFTFFYKVKTTLLIKIPLFKNRQNLTSLLFLFFILDLCLRHYILFS